MTTVIRHRLAPPVNGCRWCGGMQRGHGHCWAGRRGHLYAPPTDAQRKARLLAHIAARTAVASA